MSRPQVGELPLQGSILEGPDPDLRAKGEQLGVLRLHHLERRDQLLPNVM
jgi:hypothetical protein